MINNVFCLHPYTNLTIESGGIVRLCCATGTHIGHLSQIDNIEDFWKKSSSINLIRQEMKNGKLPSDKNICIACTRNEFLGLESRRLNYYKRFDNFRETNTPAILDMDISFSRSCNLQCTTCSSKYSSKWFVDDRKRLDMYPDRFSEIKSYIGVNPMMLDKHIEQLINIASTSKKITVKGGEPFLENNFKKFISKIENKGSKNFSVVTNGTIYNEELLDCIKQFKNYSITISIDGSPVVHKWIRNCNDELFKNIEKNAIYLNTVNIYSVVSAFNIFTLDKLINEILKQDKFKIKAALLEAITKKPDQSFLIFDKKYHSVMLDILEKSKKLIESDGRNIIKTKDIDAIINYIKSDEYLKYQSTKSKKIFLDNYERILVPSRGYCLSEIDPVFANALEDLKNELI
jgi:MoaA/NifB/PqqE/SkfB family radical SAM enzyme